MLLVALCGGMPGLPGAAAVAGAEPPALPGPVRGAGPAARQAAEARALLRAHDVGGAVRRLEAEGDPAQGPAEVAWLWTQVAPLVRGRGEVLARLQALPSGGLRAALEALLAPDAATERDRLRVASRRDRSPWLRLALLHVLARLGEHAELLGEARALGGAASASVRVEAWLLSARACVHLGRLPQALALAAEVVREDPQDARGPSLEAEVLRRLGRVIPARDALRRALALAPRSESLARRLADLVREEGAVVPAGEWAAIGVVLDRRNPEAEALRARLLLAQDDRAGALAALDRALAAGARPVPLERERRHLLAQAGRWTEVVEALEAASPAAARERGDSLLRARWQDLRRAVEAAPGPQAPPEAVEALAAALVAVGALPDAQHVLAGVDTPGARALARRVEGQQAFERVLREEVETGYRAGHMVAQGRPQGASLARVLARMAAAAVQHLAPEEAQRLSVPGAGLREVGLVGAWLDHRVHSEAPLVQHFRAYGRYLVLGQRSDGPVEAIVFSLAALVPAAPVTVRGQALQHDLALGYDRGLRSFVDAQGGGLAGACLPDGLWLDADAALEAQHEALAALRRDPSLVEAASAMPLPAADGPRGLAALDDPGAVRLRLLAAHQRASPHERWAGLATLAVHEEGHVLDLRRHLPLWQGLPSTVRLLAREGLSATRFEAALERRAQLWALAASPHPYLVLAEMVERLPAEERDADPHSLGYRDALARLVAHVAADAGRYPQVDRTRLVLAQLDRLAPAQLQAAARALLD